MKNFHKFTVAGHGQFPMDMLRYDSCFPHSPDDVRGLESPTPGTAGSRAPREVTLIHHDHRSWLPTEGRWNSFGWRVLSHEVAK